MFSESSVEELWSKAESLLGPVHCLVNNAGVSITPQLIFIMIILGDGGEGGVETDPRHQFEGGVVPTNKSNMKFS